MKDTVRVRPEADGAVAGPSREYNGETESENSDEESAKMLADILEADKEAQELEDQERAWELVRQQERESSPRRRRWRQLWLMMMMRRRRRRKSLMNRVRNLIFFRKF